MKLFHLHLEGHKVPNPLSDCSKVSFRDLATNVLSILGHRLIWFNFTVRSGWVELAINLIPLEER